VGLIFSQTVDGETLTVPVGVTSGVVRVTKNACTIEGTDRDNCIIRSDGSLGFTNLIQSSGSTPVDSLTIRNCTLDMNNQSGMSLCVGSDLGALDVLYLDNVRIINTHRNTKAILNDSYLYCTDVEIWGTGGGLQITQRSHTTFVNGYKQYGGRFGIINSDVGPANTIESVCLWNCEIFLDYWESPTYESADIVSVGQTYVEVASHVEADRSFADCLRLLNPIGTYDASLISPPFGEQWDRVELADGTWTYIESVIAGYRKLAPWRNAGTWNLHGPVTGTATVYSVVIGRMGEYTGNQLKLTFAGIWPTPRWRTVNGTTVVNPQATRLDIIRHGISNPSVRDIDSGGIHLNKQCDAPYMNNIYVRGGFSDEITVRSRNAIVENCTVLYGQDMGFTMDSREGAQSYINCTAISSGVYGFTTVGSGGTITMLDVSAINCGWHGEGLYGIGVEIGGPPVVLRIKEAYGNRITQTGHYTAPLLSTSAIPFRGKKLVRR
jgi:hypothetical protein